MRKPVMYNDPQRCPNCEFNSIVACSLTKEYKLEDVNTSAPIVLLKCKTCKTKFFPMWTDDGKLYPATSDEINDFLKTLAVSR